MLAFLSAYKFDSKLIESQKRSFHTLILILHLIEKMALSYQCNNLYGDQTNKT